MFHDINQLRIFTNLFPQLPFHGQKYPQHLFFSSKSLYRCFIIDGSTVQPIFFSVFKFGGATLPLTTIFCGHVRYHQISGCVAATCSISLICVDILIYSFCFSKNCRNYPLVNVYKTMENHHFQWVIPLFQWPFSIAFCMFTRPGNLPNPNSRIWVEKCQFRAAAASKKTARRSEHPATMVTISFKWGWVKLPMKIPFLVGWTSINPSYFGVH